MSSSTLALLSDVTALPPPTTNDGGLVLLFGAAWHPSSVEGGEVYKVVQTLQSISSCKFGRVEAESCPDLVQRLEVTVIPTVCLLDSSNSLVQKLNGVEDIALVTQAVKALEERTKSSASQTVEESTSQQPQQQAETLNDRLKRLISSAPVMLFMKGTPEAPRCGFSRQMVELLREERIPSFGSFDILMDEDVRQGLKTYSDWPTYPQLYVHGELIGGLDIVKEMQADGGLAEQFGIEQSNKQEQSLEERLGQLVKRHRIMLFLKGLPSAPQCGFSRQAVELLDKHGANYDSFNILQDEEVRQGLKEYSDWPTYPQLYVEGELIGGLDILKELEENDELRDLLKE